jgi:hypothetical protein
MSSSAKVVIIGEIVSVMALIMTALKKIKKPGMPGFTDHAS